MADIQVTDDLGKAAPNVKIDFSQPSSLLKYAKTELLHLAVAPDFIERAALPLTAAAPNPISFHLTLQHAFQLGDSNPEIDLSPSFQARIRANMTKGSNLFDEDPFSVASTVPDQTGYVSLALEGSLDLGVCGSAGDLTFGFDAIGTIGLEYWKAFQLGAGEPNLGEATGETISGFVIPADVEDLKLLALNDVCTVSGQGSLKISGGFNVSAVPNPLASVDLPLTAKTLQVKTGPMAGISASFTITGSYQVRARRTSADVVELSFCKQRGTTLKTDLSASAGVSVTVGSTDLLKSLLSAISTNPTDDATKKLFKDGGLSQDEIATLTGGIKNGLDHCLQASLDLALSQITDDQAAFQYEIRPGQLDATGSAAIRLALKGDLSGLTALETGNEGATLAPGVKLISSVLTVARTRGTAFKLNLLGLVNFISASDFVRNCVVVKDPGTGDLTITDNATGSRINAQVEDMRRSEALHKAMFESLMLTATYRVSNAIDMTGIASHNFHFAFNRDTSSAILADRLNWLVVMNLLTKPEADNYLKQFPGGGPSTCLLRTAFDDHACQSLFFEAPGQPWGRDHYLEIGRKAMRALIDPNNSDVDGYRCALLDQHWADAVAIGPNNNLAPLVGLHLTDSTGQMITQYLIGDVYTIDWWATAMQTASGAIIRMQTFVAGADPATLADNAEFANRRDELQKTMAGVIGNSRTRFDEPWGLVSLFWAAGSIGAFARLVAKEILVEKTDSTLAAVVNTSK
jgi:hypothetical protein